MHSDSAGDSGMFCVGSAAAGAAGMNRSGWRQSERRFSVRDRGVSGHGNGGANRLGTSLAEFCSIIPDISVVRATRGPVTARITVAVGMAVRQTRGLENQLLERSKQTWMAAGNRWLTVLVMMQCGSVEHTNRTIGGIHWVCSTLDAWPRQLGENYLVLAELLRQLRVSLPSHDYYLKVDADTMTLPSNLLGFLRSLPRRLASEPLYFGSNEVSTKNVRSAEVCQLHGDDYCHTINYAQGGAEGLSRLALERVVDTSCITRIGSTPCRRENALCIHKAEDVTLGICMRALGVPFTRCPCFFAWGPCNIFETTSCHNKLCARPVTIHKLKRISWFDGWWEFLTRP